MKYDFKRTFDAVTLSPECQERICTRLSAHTKRPRKKIRILRLLTAAALLVSAIALMGFAFGERITKLLGGGRIVEGIDENGEDSVSVDTGFAVDPVTIWNDHIYFTLDGSYQDITEECSDTDSYRYESCDEDGTRHIILIGGAPDHVGWAEYTLLPDGRIFSNATYDGGTKPLWLVNADTSIRAEFPDYR